MLTAPIRIAFFTAITLNLASLVGAEERDRDRGWTTEVSATVGAGHVFRFDDEGFGTPFNAGAAIGVAHRTGFLVEFGVEQVFGLEAKPAPCGLVDNTCTGGGRYGPYEAAVAAVTVQYRFRGHRVQPFVLAGIGKLATSSFHTTTYAATRPAVMVESASSDSGFGPDLGGGLRLNVTRFLAVSPEVRWLDASLRSRENLAVARFGIRTTLTW